MQTLSKKVQNGQILWNLA